MDTQDMMVPSYFFKFNCIADRCEETCCSGWYIEVDDVTYKRYKHVKNKSMLKKINQEIVVKKGKTRTSIKIKLKNNRCAFLDTSNLCEIYKELGPIYLSETCKMYPRNTNQINDKIELALALSCPEAARIILLNKEKITFKQVNLKKLPIVGARVELNLNKPKCLHDYLFEVRAVLIKILQDRQLSIMERWVCIEKVLMRVERYAISIKGLDDYLYKIKNEGYKVLKTEKLSLQTENLLSKETTFKIVKQLVSMREKKKWPSERYERCYTKVRQFFEEENRCYEQLEDSFNTIFLRERDYILENYFVNYIYERLVPFNCETVVESFKEMSLYFILLKIHLMVGIDKKGYLSDNIIIECIQSFTRVFDHNELYIKQIKKII